MAVSNTESTALPDADEDECEECATLPDGVPCAACYISGRTGFSGGDRTFSARSI